MDDEPDYDAVMRANLARVFSEPDPAARRAAIAELYAPDAVLYEPDHVASGPEEIAAAVETLLRGLPPGFAFEAEGPAVGHHGVGRLRWRGGPSGGPVAVTGTDVARIAGGRIDTLHVLLDPPRN